MVVSSSPAGKTPDSGSGSSCPGLTYLLISARSLTYSSGLRGCGRRRDLLAVASGSTASLVRFCVFCRFGGCCCCPSAMESSSVWWRFGFWNCRSAPVDARWRAYCSLLGVVRTHWRIDRRVAYA